MQVIKFTRLLDLEQLLKAKTFFLFGPRSTGKSTLIADTLPEAKVYDLLDDEVFQRLLRSPKIIEEELGAKNGIIVIDEIQKLPKLLDEVQRLLKKYPQLKFLLTGSSARKIKRGSANLLGGRAWEAQMHPLVTAEIPHFDLLRYLNVGGIPHIYLSINPKEELKSYANLYLREEIIAEALVRNLEHFTRFLDILALVNGEELHFQGIANDSGVQVKTVRNYVEILEDTLLGFQVPAFKATKKRKAISRSKFYFFDLGVLNRLAKRSEIIDGNEVFGKAFEHFIARELKSYLSYRRLDDELCYWRSTSNLEVDFVIGKNLALEVKASTQVGEGHLKGLLALQEEKLIKRFIVVSRDPTPRKISGIEIIPWQTFLKMLWDDEFSFS